MASVNHIVPCLIVCFVITRLGKCAPATGKMKLLLEEVVDSLKGDGLPAEREFDVATERLRKELVQLRDDSDRTNVEELKAKLKECLRRWHQEKENEFKKVILQKQTQTEERKHRKVVIGDVMKSQPLMEQQEISNQSPNPDETLEELKFTHAQKVFLGLESEKRVKLNDTISKRKTMTEVWKTWPNGRVPWEFDSDHQFQFEVSKDEIWKAIYHWQNETCLRFPERNSGDVDYLKLGTGKGCSSWVGRIGGGQKINLQEPGCILKGVIAHELGHAIGFLHEQSRSDRDDFVKIVWENIASHATKNFKKQSTSVEVEYDLESDMHYSLVGFSINGLPTIEVKTRELSFLAGNRAGLTFYDAKAANILYNCSRGCNGPCYGHGYPFRRPNGTCMCRCPRGLTGDCRQIDRTFSDFPACGGVYDLKTEGATVTIKSPNYPRNYDLNKICVYVIKGPQKPNSGIIIKVNDFEVDSDRLSDQCVHTLEVSANLIGQTGIKYCGSYTSAPHQAHTFLDHKAKEMMLIFNTHGGGSAKKGFFFTVKATTNLDPCLKCPRSASTCDINTGVCKCFKGYTGIKCDVRNSVTAVSCNFNKGFCAWIQRKDDQEDWIRLNGQTPSSYTGPDGGPDNSSYVYAEASGGSQGDSTIMETPWLAGGTFCLRFYYHMYGSDMGSLELILLQKNGITTVIFMQSGDKGNTWHFAAADVSSASIFKLQFMAIRGTSYMSDVALDEITFSRGRCQGSATQAPPTTTSSTTTRTSPTGSVTTTTPSTGSTTPANVIDYRTVSCTFDTGSICGWIQETTDMFDWTPHSGPTLSVDTGPSQGDGGTAYIYAEMSTPRQNGDYATISVGPIAGGKYCLSFKWHMYGYLKMGRLVLRNNKRILFEQTGSHGDMWHSQRVDIDEPSNFKLSFTAERLHTWQEDIALDTIVFTKGPCPKLTTTTTTTSTSTTTVRSTTTPRQTISGPISCDFETGSACIFVNDPSNDFNWTVKHANSANQGGGPTSGFGGSSYFIVAQGSSRAPGVAKLMTNAWLNSPVCVKWAYFLDNFGMADFRVKVLSVDGRYSQPVWYMQGMMGPNWLTDSVVIDRYANYKVVFEVEISSTWTSNAALDNVELVPGNSCN